MQESARHPTRRRRGIGGAWVAINSLQHTRTLPFSDQDFEVFATELTIRIIGSLFRCMVLNPLDSRFIRRLTESFRLPVPVESNYLVWVRWTFGGSKRMEEESSCHSRMPRVERHITEVAGISSIRSRRGPR